MARPALRTVPGRLDDTLVLHLGDRIAALVGDIAAYPTGFAFSLTSPTSGGPHLQGRTMRVD